MSESKRESLQKDGALNPHPEEVRDEIFAERDFFDPIDLVQVKYEMLRRVRADGWSVTDAAATYGYSRPTFYKAKEDFEEGGVSRLIPQKRGPRGGHKLTEEVIDALEARLEEDGSLSSEDLAGEVLERYGVSIHPRSVERALQLRKKKLR